MALLWLNRLGAAHRRSPRSIRMGFVVNKEAVSSVIRYQ
jgi:hypothetical protein